MSILCCYKSQSLSVSHSLSISLSLYPFPSCVYIKCIVPGYPCYCSSWSKALIAPLTGGRGEYSNKIHCFVANLNVIIICEKQHSDEFLIIQLIFFFSTFSYGFPSLLFSHSVSPAVSCSCQPPPSPPPHRTGYIMKGRSPTLYSPWYGMVGSAAAPAAWPTHHTESRNHCKPPHQLSYLVLRIE